jgi:hypothetical protein
MARDALNNGYDLSRMYYMKRNKVVMIVTVAGILTVVLGSIIGKQSWSDSENGTGERNVADASAPAERAGKSKPAPDPKEDPEPTAKGDAVQSNATTEQHNKNSGTKIALANEQYRPVYEPGDASEKYNNISRAANDLSYARKFNKEDIPRLIRMYNENELVERQAIVRIMAYLGGDEVWRAFKHTLMDEFAGVDVTRKEELFLVSMVGLAGMVARNSDEAYEFLLSAKEESYWAKHRGWKAQREEIDRRLARQARSGLGYSGREGVPEVIKNDVAEKGQITYQAQSTARGAMYKWEMARTIGDEFLVKDKYNSIRKLAEWQRTNNYAFLAKPPERTRSVDKDSNAPTAEVQSKPIVLNGRMVNNPENNPLLSEEYDTPEIDALQIEAEGKIEELRRERSQLLQYNGLSREERKVRRELAKEYFEEMMRLRVDYRERVMKKRLEILYPAEEPEGE